MTTQLLITSDLRNLAPYSIEGAQALRLRPQIDRAMEACLGQDGPSLLATADDSPGGAVLGWLTELPGDPVPRASLSQGERLILDRKLSEASASIQAEAGRLLLSKSKDDRILSGFLQNIAGSLGAIVSGDPSPLSAFMVGDRPVVAGWGLVPSQVLGPAPDAAALGPGQAPLPLATPPGPSRAGSPGEGPAERKRLPKALIAVIIAIVALSLLLALIVPMVRDRFLGTRGPVDGFVIPAGGDPKDLSFLEGCWDSGKGALDGTTMLPITHVYCLNHRGTGSYTVKEFDESMRLTDTCSGGLTALRVGDSVVMEVQEAACGKGDGYQPFSLRCVNGQGKTAKCSGEYADGDTFQSTLSVSE
ncbi:MAG: hypothetical protein LBF40_01560 [Deltaproteobacteria bacterium]|jgi:hypothetical protein|nr:hypothetical protein [Deltaproteobacteria bacterium]